ncbi:UNVERIFIED_CONTAM: RusA family crossover junction endodeoxyribonuclease [Methylobacteriaceae bacterium AG10]|nr:RusA family crossover junction endodeoxyribonuclease [Methylobacteriaceae bacterium AG10]
MPVDGSPSARVISFVIPGEPVPFARAGARGAIRFTPKRQRDFMSLAKLAAHQAMAGRAPLEGPVELTVEAIFLAPSGWSKKKRAATVWKLSRPDLSNIEKLVEDSLNEIVFLDDTQVVRRGPSTCKRYGERAETRVSVRVLDDADAEALR